MVIGLLVCAFMAVVAYSLCVAASEGDDDEE